MRQHIYSAEDLSSALSTLIANSKQSPEDTFELSYNTATCFWSVTSVDSREDLIPVPPSPCSIVCLVLSWKLLITIEITHILALLTSENPQ